MPSDLSIDHIVIFVNDLATATRDYENLGFTVTPGGEHERMGTHNALIAFEDDTYLELISWKDPAAASRPVSVQAPSAPQLSAAERRVHEWLKQEEGLVDFALLPKDIDEAIAAAQEGGLMLDGPLNGSRTRPDGQVVAWQFAFPDAFDLPFLCADETPRELRVPTGAAREHASGVTGLLGISVVVHNFLRSVERYRTLLGLPEEAGQVEEGAAQTKEFEVGGTKIRIVGVADQHKAFPGEPMREGAHTLLLRANRETPGQPDLHQTHGVRMWLGPEAALTKFL